MPLFFTKNPSDSANTVIFVQSAPSNIWTITHNLNKFPSVSIVDTNGTVIYAEVQYISSNEIAINFSVPVSGTAYLN